MARLRVYDDVDRDDWKLGPGYHRNDGESPEDWADRVRDMVIETIEKIPCDPVMVRRTGAGSSQEAYASVIVTVDNEESLPPIVCRSIVIKSRKFSDCKKALREARRSALGTDARSVSRVARGESRPEDVEVHRVKVEDSGDALLEEALRAYVVLWEWAAANVVDGEEAEWIYTGQPDRVWVALRVRGISTKRPEDIWNEWRKKEGKP